MIENYLSKTKKGCASPLRDPSPSRICTPFLCTKTACILHLYAKIHSIPVFPCRHHSRVCVSPLSRRASRTSALTRFTLLRFALLRFILKPSAPKPLSAASSAHVKFIRHAVLRSKADIYKRNVLSEKNLQRRHFMKV